MKHGVPEIIFSFEKNNKWDLYGVFDGHANRVTIYLNEVKTMGHLFENLEHEHIHAAFWHLGLDFIEDEEHIIIDKLQWFKGSYELP